MPNASTATAFIICTLLSFLSTALIPEIRLIAFVPFLSLILRKKTLFSLLWWAIFTGLIADLTSTHYRFGLSAFNYAIASAILYPLKGRFFEEKPLPFFMLNYSFSFLITLLFAFLSLFKGTISFPSLFDFLKETTLPSVIDGVVGFIFLFIPFKLYAEIKKKGLQGFLNSGNEL